MSEFDVDKILLDLKSDDGHVIQSTIKRLGNISNQFDKDYLFEKLILMLHDPNPYMRLRTVYALESLGDHRAVRPLIETLEDSDEEIDTELIDARFYVLCKFKDKTAIEPLISQLHRIDFKRTWDLLAFGDEAVIPMMQALKSDNPYTRWLIVYWLGTCRNQVTIPALRKAIKDSNDRVRNQSIVSLGWTRSSKAIPILSELAKDSNSEVRKYVAIALGYLKYSEVIPILKQLVNDHEQQVSQKAKESLKKSSNLSDD